MLDEFKKFVLRGNVVDLATGVIIGAAFGKIVTAFTDGIVTPVLNAFGSKDVGLIIPIAGIDFNLGILITAIINFLITAAVVFFLIIKPLNALASRIAKGEEPAPAEPSSTDALLTEIRDLLRREK